MNYGLVNNIKQNEKAKSHEMIFLEERKWRSNIYIICIPEEKNKTNGKAKYSKM